MEIFIVQIIIAVFIIVITASITSRAKRRTVEASKTLSAKSMQRIRTDYSNLAQKSFLKAWWVYWIAVVVASMLAFVGFHIYTITIEPNASLADWLPVSLIMYGIVLVTLIGSASYLVASAYQHYALRNFLLEKKNQTSLEKALNILSFRSGEFGVSLFTIAAVIGSFLVGAGIVAVLFMASQTAIECARSSKCI